MKSVIIFLFLFSLGNFISVFGDNQAESTLSLGDKNPILEKLAKDNEYVIAYRFINPSQKGMDSKYIVLVKNDYLIQAFNIENSLVKLNLSHDSLAFIWSNFMQNGLLDMKDESDLVDVCPKKYHIHNAHSYEFTIITKSKTKVLNYYYPEYYDEVCPGIEERKKIINAVAALELVLRQNN